MPHAAAKRATMTIVLPQSDGSDVFEVRMLISGLSMGEFLSQSWSQSKVSAGKRSSQACAPVYNATIILGIPLST